MTKYNKDYGYEVDIIDIDGKKQNTWKLYNLKHGSVIFESTDYNEIIEHYVHHRIQDRFGTQEVPNGKRLQFEANIRAQLHLSGQEHPGATLRDYIPFSRTAEAKITPKRYKEYRDLQFSRLTQSFFGLIFQKQVMYFGKSGSFAMLTDAPVWKRTKKTSIPVGQHLEY